MASALQCPACGHKHRLAALTGDPIFSCEECGRLLKTPVEYRRPEPSAPSEPPRPAPSSRLQRKGSAARDDTSMLRNQAAPVEAAPAATAAASRPAPSKPRPTRPRPTATLSLPLMVLGWLLALVIGGIVVRYIAKFTGLLTGDSVIDLITRSGYSRYLRLFAVVPFWALATAGLMTLFVEGGRRWQARQHAPATRPATKRPTAVPPPAPSRRAAAPAPAPAPKARPPAATPAPSETSSPNNAAAPRARRIPKRDISS